MINREKIKRRKERGLGTLSRYRRLCYLWIVNNCNFLHQFLCHIYNRFKSLSNFIRIIFFSTLLTFKAWNILNYNNAIFIIYDVCCCTIYGCTIFAIHTHIHHLFLRVFRSSSNFFLSFLCTIQSIAFGDFLRKSSGIDVLK